MKNESAGDTAVKLARGPLLRRIAYLERRISWRVPVVILTRADAAEMWRVLDAARFPVEERSWRKRKGGIARGGRFEGVACIRV
jgi:hypothetical protein